MATLPRSCSRCHLEADNTDLVVVAGRFVHRELCVDPETQRVRDAIARQVCPLCGRSRGRTGPFRVLASHVMRIHGIDKIGLRDMGLLVKHTSITADGYAGRTPEARERKRQAALERRLWERPRGRREFSKAGAMIRNQALDTGRHKAYAPDVVARRAEVQRRPHPCRICGTEIGLKDRRVCSKACMAEAKRRGNQGKWERYWDAHPRSCRCGSPIRVGGRKTCSLECARAAQRASMVTVNKRRARGDVAHLG